MLKTMNLATRRGERRKTQAGEELARISSYFTMRSESGGRQITHRGAKSDSHHGSFGWRGGNIRRRRPSREQSREAAPRVHTELHLLEAMPPEGRPGNGRDHIQTPERGLITAMLWSEGLVLDQSRSPLTPQSSYGDSQG